MNIKKLALSLFIVLATALVINFLMAVFGSGITVLNFENGPVLILLISALLGASLVEPFVDNRTTFAIKFFAAPAVIILTGYLLVWLWGGNLISGYDATYDFFTNLESARICACHNWENLWNNNTAIQENLLFCFGWLAGVGYMASCREEEIELA